MKNYLYIILVSLLFITACESDLDQFPENNASSDSLTNYAEVLNAAYYYLHGTCTPMAVMGDFRADNARMQEAPYTEFDTYGPNLTDMSDQFFGPLYTAAYRSILSANNVIDKSQDPGEVAQARFLRGLVYFKIVKAFGDVTINTSSNPDPLDNSILARSPASEVYNTVIIPDLEAAMAALPKLSDAVGGRASKEAAQGMLAKVHMQLGNFASAEPLLSAVIGGGATLKAEYNTIFGEANDLNSEIIFATQFDGDVPDEYGFSEFGEWSRGLDTKSLMPLDPDLVAAFDAVAGAIADPAVGDLRRAVTIDTLNASPKFPQENVEDHDFIELRLADVILLYAEALNETGSSPADCLSLLDPLRVRAGLNTLDPDVLDSQEAVRQAIYDERRMELAFEGHRWFDLVRTGTVDEEMGETINSNYHVFPMPNSEVISFDEIEQNPGY